MPKYYAVARGRVPGVYSDWNACKVQVVNVSNAKFKKFDSPEEASEFVRMYKDPTPVKINSSSAVKPPLTLPLPLSPSKSNRQVNNLSQNLVDSSQPKCLSLPPPCTKTGSNAKKLNLGEPRKPLTIQQAKFVEPSLMPVKNVVNDLSNIQPQGIEDIDNSRTLVQGESSGVKILPSTCDLDNLEERFEAFEKMYREFHKHIISEIRSTKKILVSFKQIDLENISLQMELQASVADSMNSLENSFKTVMVDFSSELSLLQKQMAFRKIMSPAKKSARQPKAKEHVAAKKKGVSATSSKKATLKKLAAMMQPMTPAQVLVANKRSYSTDMENGCEPPLKLIKSEAENENDVIIIKDEPVDEADSGGVHQFDVDAQGYVHVYTDGACENNGRKGAKAGIGVWFGSNHPLNSSEPVRGRPTNNTAEIQAAQWAVVLARSAGVNRLCINTDSEFLIKSMTMWIGKWKKNNWQLSTGGPVKNKENFEELEAAMRGMQVKWNHVRGHVGILGNEMADSLARSGAARYKNS